MEITRPQGNLGGRIYPGMVALYDRTVSRLIIGIPPAMMSVLAGLLVLNAFATDQEGNRTMTVMCRKKCRDRSFNPASGPAAKAGLAVVAAGLIGAAILPAQAADIAVKNPSMRLIIKSRPAAGYFTLQNDTANEMRLTGASSPACGMLMMHQSKRKNGIDSMAAVESVPVPAHGSVRFAPGGYHLMCMSPQPTMVVGKSVPVTLSFAGGKTVTAEFPVQGPGGR